MSIRSRTRFAAVVLALAPLAGVAQDGARVADSQAGRAVVADTDPLAIADALERDLRRHPLRLDDEALERYLHGVVCRLAPVDCPALRVLVLRRPGLNALVAPNGLLVVWSGTLLRVRDEAELASVLAHEIAHHRRGDAARRWREDGARVGVGARLRAWLAGDDADAARVDDERAADADAAALVAAAGFDGAAAARFWQRVVAEERAAGSTAAAGAHPRTADRLARAQATAGAQGDAGDAAFRAAFASALPVALDIEVRRGRGERSRALVDARLAAYGPAADDGAWAFARGELARRAGDRAGAATAYAQAVAVPAPPAGAWREHGLARLAAGDRAGGRDALSRYLQRQPEADDSPYVRWLLDDAVVPTVAPHGTSIRVFDIRVASELAWRRQRGIGIEQWMLAGDAPNRLLIVGRLRPGEALFRDIGRRHGPRYRAGLRPDEVRDLVADAVRASGWPEAATPALRPAAFAGVPGWRFELATVAEDGTAFRGSAAFAERNGRLTLLVWLGPADDGRYPAVATMLDSLRFVD